MKTPQPLTGKQENLMAKVLKDSQAAPKSFKDIAEEAKSQIKPTGKTYELT